MWKETARNKGYWKYEIETQCSGNCPKSMKGTLLRSPKNEDTGSQLAISHHQLDWVAFS